MDNKFISLGSKVLMGILLLIGIILIDSLLFLFSTPTKYYSFDAFFKLIWDCSFDEKLLKFGNWF